MKRTVTLVLAAVLLSPACGMAAPREGGEEIVGTRGWEIITGWITSLFMDGAATQEGTTPDDGWEKGGVGPLPELGTTWDADG